MILNVRRKSDVLIKTVTILISVILMFTYLATATAQSGVYENSGSGNTSPGASGNEGSVYAAAGSINGYNVSYGNYRGTLVLSNDSYVHGYFNATNGLGPVQLAYAPQLNEIFVSEYSSNSISAINETSRKIIYTIYAGKGPDGLYFDQKNDILYVADSGSNRVSEIYALTGKLIGSIRVGNNPQLFAYDPENNTLFVSNWNSNNVTVINTITNIPVGSVNVGNNPSGIAYDPDNNYVYVSNYNSNYVTAIDATNYTVMANVGVGSNPEGIAVDSYNGHVFVADSGSAEVTVLNGANEQILLEISVQSNPSSIVINSTDNYTYVSNYGSNSISVFNGVNNEFVTTVLLPSSSDPEGMLFVPKGGLIFVADYNINEISIVVASKYILKSNIYISYTPDEVAYDPANGEMYITDSSRSLVYVVSVENYSIVKIINVSSDPTDIIYDSFNGNIYVATWGVYNVTVINGGNNNIVATPYVGGDPYKLALNTVNGDVYVSVQSPSTGWGSFGGTGNIGVSIISAENSSDVSFISLNSIPYSLAYDPANNYLYVAVQGWYLGFWQWWGYDGLIAINMSSYAYSSTDFGSAPWGVAYDPTSGNIYVTDASSNNLYVVNTTTEQMVLTIPVSVTPTQVFYNPWNQDIYTLNRGANSLSVVSSINNTIVDTVLLANSPHSLAMDISNGYMLVTQNNNASVGFISLFSSSVYYLEFREKGITKNIGWSITLNQYITLSSSSSTISFGVPNGTYSFSAQDYVNYSSVDRFAAVQYSGSITVNGESVVKNITYVEQYYLTMMSVPKNGGSVFPGSGWFNSGAAVNISESSNRYFKFTGWTGNGNGSYSGSSSTVTVVMQSPLTEVANFVKLFNATFSTVGLPSGVKWSVYITGSNTFITEYSVTPEIDFLLPNGTYNFTVNTVQGFLQSPENGTFTINNTSISENIMFTRLYSVTFYEQGLPSGTNWSVTLSNYTNIVINTINLQNSFYPLNSILDPYNGYIYVIGSNGYLDIIDPMTETIIGSMYLGEPDLTSIAYDQLNQNLYITSSYYNNVIVVNSISNSIIEYIKAGNEPVYDIYDPVNGYIYVANYASSNITVINGQNNQVIGTIAVGNGTEGLALDTENGYIYSANFIANTISVINSNNDNVVATLNVGTVEPIFDIYDPYNNNVYVLNYNTSTVSVIDTSDNSIVSSIALENNSDPYGMVYDPMNNYIYVTSLNTSTVSVIDPGTSSIIQNLAVGSGPVSISYDPNNGLLYVSNYFSDTISVIFYALNTYTTKYSTGNSITFYEIPGYYYYNVTNSQKYFAVNGNGSVVLNNTNISIDVTFMGFVQKNYTVTFSETGLPSNEEWYVDLNGTNVSSYSSTISFEVPNGTYSYTVETPIAIARGAEYVTVGYGTVKVDGSNIEVMVTYTEEFYLETSASPSGGGTVNPASGWFVAGTTVTIYANPNSGFTFVKWTGTGQGSYTGSQSNVSITMNGPIQEVATFARTYIVTFTESGLKSGTFWGVSISSNITTNAYYNMSTRDYVTFYLPNGTYSFKVRNVTGYVASPQRGSLTVSGSEISVVVTYTYIPVEYSVTFTETGLANGITWSVTLNSKTEYSSNSTIVFNEPNGTYSFAVQAIPGYRSSPAYGTITVSGSSLSEYVDWSIALYPITVTVAGLPSGTSWSATLTGTTFTGQSINITESSVNSSIVFSEPNGTYTYVIHLPSGYTSSASSGTLRVSGSPVSSSISVSKLIKTPTTDYMMYVIIAVVVIVAAVGAAIAMTMRRR